MDKDQLKLLAECSIRDGEQRYNASDIADLLSNDNTCLCGKPLSDNGPNCYEHMSKGY